MAISRRAFQVIGHALQWLAGIDPDNVPPVARELETARAGIGHGPGGREQQDGGKLELR